MSHHSSYSRFSFSDNEQLRAFIRRNRKKILLGIGIIVLLAIAIFGLVVLVLWNFIASDTTVGIVSSAPKNIGNIPLGNILGRLSTLSFSEVINLLGIFN